MEQDGDLLAVITDKSANLLVWDANNSKSQWLDTGRDLDTNNSKSQWLDTGRD